MQLLFGECVLDTETRQLLRSGERSALTPKAFELLQALLLERPRALSKAALRARLWPDTHVLEANLPNLVAEVRAAVGDDARRPRFVRTVHGFGYAFCGEAAQQAPAPRRAGERPFVYRLASEDGVAALAEGEYILGRSADSAVPIDSGRVSRRHARLRVADGAATLEDLGSKNGTYVKGEPIAKPARLVDGDEFQLGSLRFTFRVSRTSDMRETLDGN